MYKYDPKKPPTVVFCSCAKVYSKSARDTTLPARLPPPRPRRGGGSWAGRPQIGVLCLTPSRQSIFAHYGTVLFC